jgi:hypothetical protein
MMMWSKRLRLVVLLVLGVMGISTMFAIINKLPYEVGGTGDPNTVAADFITRGTAISPPLFILLVLLLFAALTLRRGWVGTVGVMGIILLGVVAVVAGLQEPIVWRTLQASAFGVFEIGIIVLESLSLVLALTMIVCGVLALIERNRTRWPAPAER